MPLKKDETIPSPWELVTSISAGAPFDCYRLSVAANRGWLYVVDRGDGASISTTYVPEVPGRDRSAP